MCTGKKGQGHLFYLSVRRSVSLQVFTPEFSRSPHSSQFANMFIGGVTQQELFEEISRLIRLQLDSISEGGLRAELVVEYKQRERRIRELIELLERPV